MRNLIWVTLFTVGCISGALPTDGSDGSADLALGNTGRPPTGIYRVEAAPATGTCDPPGVSGPLSQPVEVYGGIDFNGALRVATPSVSSTGQVSGFSSEDVRDGAWHAKIDSCGAWQDISISVTGESDSAYTFTRSARWSNTAGADRSVVCDPPVPASDCQTSVNLRFTLLQACPPPNCLVMDSPPPPPGEFQILRCVCADGGAS